MNTTFRTVARAAVAIGAAALVAAGCGSSGDGDSATASSATGPNAGATLSLVAFSTPREAYEELIPKFQETKAGAGVEFTQSYGSSGEQSRAIEGGLPTDLTHLALEPDVTRNVEAGLIDADWNSGEHEGILTRSTVALVVRKGNPKKIEGWDDLLGDDIEVVTANPFTSGGARWNLMAAYGAWRHAGDSEKQALDKLEQLLRNTPVQSKSAREALQVFASGKGDVMLSYEQEAIQAEVAGEDFEHFVPDSTILIENPAAITSTTKESKAARAFLDYLYTPEAQKVFASFGYRPVVEEAAEVVDFPEPADLFTIEEFGGWGTVMDEFFDREKGHVAEINKELGVPTDG